YLHVWATLNRTLSFPLLCRRSKKHRGECVSSTWPGAWVLARAPWSDVFAKRRGIAEKIRVHCAAAARRPPARDGSRSQLNCLCSGLFGPVALHQRFQANHRLCTEILLPTRERRRKKRRIFTSRRSVAVVTSHHENKNDPHSHHYHRVTRSRRRIRV